MSEAAIAEMRVVTPVERTYQAVREAMLEAQAQGVGFRQHGWGLNYKATPEGWEWYLSQRDGLPCEVCALGAYMLGRTTRSSDQRREAASLLGITLDEASALIDGFDDNRHEHVQRRSPYFQAGARLRREFLVGR